MSNGEFGQVTQTDNTGTISQAETEQQATVRTEAESVQVPTDYHFMIEQGNHKVIVKPERGLNYNFHALCTCAWEGRYLTQDVAEHAAKVHLANKFPSRG